MIEHLLKSLANIYYERLPKRILRITRPLVEPAYAMVRRICTIALDIYPPVTLFRGNGSSDNSYVTLLIAGKGDVFPLFTERIFRTEPEACRRGRKFIWNIPSLNSSQADAVMIEADRCFSRFWSQRGFVAIPEWIMFTMDISTPADEIFMRWKKRAGKNYKRIRDHNYTYEVSRDREKLHFFYDKMYLPYMAGRFGKLTLLVSFGYMENLLQKGVLLLVKREGEYVSGGFISTAASTPMFAFLGVIDGRRDYVKQGAISALYYFNILWAKEKGYTKVNFGHTRPLLNDGLYQYKKRWGMRIHRSHRKHRVLYLSLGRPNSYLEQFLIDNPLVYDDRGKLKGMLFFHRNDQLAIQEIEALKRKYSVAGLEGFTLVPLDSPITQTSCLHSKR